MIKTIEIENIKGICHKKIELDITPNKPSLLVAPNGFGKSSLAVAFKSMNNSRIVLDKNDYYKGLMQNQPQIKIEYKKTDRSTVYLVANNNENSISKEIDYFVINSLLKPKGIGSPYGKATARLDIEDVVLIDKISIKTKFQYSINGFKEQFGINGKILPNATYLLDDKIFVKQMSEHYLDLQYANRVHSRKKIHKIITNINTQKGTEDVIFDWIKTNCLNELQQIDYLNTISNLINEFLIGANSDIESYLVAIQLIWLYDKNKNNFTNACNYNNYLLEKQQFEKTLSTFNCTWKNIRPSETNGKLVVKFPKAIDISNGQRDILTFISMLFRAKQNLKKTANILIIDEVFDYLDDANLTVAQYYVTQFIEEFKNNGKQIYPLILTHLNPDYFKNYAFKYQKVYYLDKSKMKVDVHLQQLLKNREDKTIKDDVSKYLLHYNPQTINKRAEFKTLHLLEIWGVGNNFIDFLNDQKDKYLNDKNYDPFAVCGALRIQIEKIAFDKLKSVNAKNKFIATHTTRSKLEKAEEMGVVSPESHYLLGIIYNEAMHWKDNQDNVSPVASKLENLVIKKLIRDVFEKEH
jgi:ABC-type multidrug transport system ATPase subunit